MTVPAGFTDDMNIELPEGVMPEEVVDLIISMKDQGSSHDVIESCLIEKFAINPYDAALAWDRVCAGLVRASTGSQYNCPNRRKDSLAWLAFQRGIQGKGGDPAPKLQQAAPDVGTPWWKFW
jgi:hypothetical protein